MSNDGRICYMYLDFFPIMLNHGLKKKDILISSCLVVMGYILENTTFLYMPAHSLLIRVHKMHLKLPEKVCFYMKY